MRLGNTFSLSRHSPLNQNAVRYLAANQDNTSYLLKVKFSKFIYFIPSYQVVLWRTLCLTASITVSAILHATNANLAPEAEIESIATESAVMHSSKESPDLVKHALGLPPGGENVRQSDAIVSEKDAVALIEDSSVGEAVDRRPDLQFSNINIDGQPTDISLSSIPAEAVESMEVLKAATRISMQTPGAVA